MRPNTGDRQIRRTTAARTYRALVSTDRTVRDCAGKQGGAHEYRNRALAGIRMAIGTMRKMEPSFAVSMNPAEPITVSSAT